jgi:hypothetical protein
MASGSYFTYEERERVRQLFAEGCSRDSIAEKLGRSRSAVDRQMNQMGLRSTPVRRGPLFKPEGTYQVPPKRPNDHLAHCQAIMGADEPGKPYGCGFPVCVIPPAYRVAA